jgi:hypothetical protein
MSASVKSQSAAFGFSIFLTAYDPLDLASNSIDVLGFQRGYIALADKILPGFTTVTSFPRYTSMLCAAIRTAQDKYRDSAETPVRLRQQRLEAVKSYERAWALACDLVSSEGQIGAPATDGLRGVQFVERRLSQLSGREKYISTNSFSLLANQVRYGGIGAYSTFLEDCHLANMRPLSLRPLGETLADAFPRPAGTLAVHDDDHQLSLEELRDWGRLCHLAAITKGEADTIKDALRGGEEGGWEDDVRWSMLRLLAGAVMQEDPERIIFKNILSGIKRGQFAHLNLPTECVEQIRAAMIVTLPYEKLSQSFQFLFDAVRAAATDTPEVNLKEVGERPDVLEASEAAKSAAAQLLAGMEEAQRIHPNAAGGIMTALTDVGIVGLLGTISASDSAHDMLDLVLDRHQDVQQGKFDKGGRKAPWIKRDTFQDKVSLSAQRHQLIVADRKKSWEQMPWHPYRTVGALRFIRQCRIR